MLTISRRVPGPRLRWVPGAIACRQGHRVILTPWPPAAGQTVEFFIETLPGGGYGVVLQAGERRTVLARYPSERRARRQLRRLLAADSGTGSPGWLGRGLMMAAILFLGGFLFVLPTPPSSTVPAANAPGSALPTLPPPALIDDPARASRAEHPTAAARDADQGFERAFGLRR